MAKKHELTQEERSRGGRNRAERIRKRKEQAEELAIEKLSDALVKSAEVFIAGLEAEGVVVVGSGEDAQVHYFPHHGQRIRAADKVFDRVVGRPKQQTELTGRLEVDLSHARDKLASLLADRAERRGKAKGS